MIRRLRRLVGAALLAWSAWTILRSWWPRPTFEARYGADSETGDLYGVRITPLSPAERALALQVERDFYAGAIDWTQRQRGSDRQA